MLRTTLLALALSVGAACHHDPKPIMAEGEVPPLPPSSGTPVGYLLDNAEKLKLTPEQFDKLKAIDNSLAARNDGLDTQIREIEKPEDEEPHEKPKPGSPPPKPMNNAPGAFAVHQTPDSGKLHAAKDANSKDALTKAFALLDDTQRATARKLLDDRGITAPGAAPGPGPGKQPPPKTENDNGGVPLEP